GMDPAVGRHGHEGGAIGAVDHVMVGDRDAVGGDDESAGGGGVPVVASVTFVDAGDHQDARLAIGVDLGGGQLRLARLRQGEGAAFAAKLLDQLAHVGRLAVGDEAGGGL